MIKSIPFRPGHLDLIKLADVHGDDDHIVRDYNEGLVNNTYMETIIDEEKQLVLGLMNGILVHDKCLELCMVTSQSAVKSPIGFTKHIKKSIDYYEKKLEVHRVQATIRSGYPHLVKFMKMLGFHKESTMKRFGLQGDDYDMYVRFCDGV